MKTLDIMAIPLSRGLFALVDGKNYEWLKKRQWHASKSRKAFYASRVAYDPIKKRSISIFMHREILGLTRGDGKISDHINHCGLDNREINLRSCTNQQNLQSSLISINNKSGYKGVSWEKQTKKWRAQVMCDRKIFYLGCYDKKEDAAKVYDAKAKELFGEFANTNF